jgi:hypothetical protein
MSIFVKRYNKIIITKKTWLSTIKSENGRKIVDNSLITDTKTVIWVIYFRKNNAVF